MPASAVRPLAIAASLLLATVTAFAQEAPREVQDQPQLPHWRDPGLVAAEIVGFQVLLNRFNYCCGASGDREDYHVTMDSIRRNLHHSWVVDHDPFSVNQLGHPYSGSMYYGFARSNGFNFWESGGAAIAGSALWEIAGETTPPSRNDLISTGIGGSFLGESLFRMANLLLEQGGGMSPFWRETVAAVASPSTAFNRYLQGRGPATVFSSRGAPYYSRVDLGVMGSTQTSQGNSTATVRNEAQAQFSLDYGMPGKEDYQYRNPFDYFAFQATATTANWFENVMTRGMLAGANYRAGRNYRGIWGLYGSYDYISPQIFRISTTALSLGTTGQWRNGDWVVQGTGTAGVGYAAVGTINSTAGGSDQDYHYGVAPQALLAGRLIHADQWALDITAREYFVTDIVPGSRGGHDNIVRADIGYTWRIRGPHAISVKYLWNRRDAQYPDLGDRSQTRGTVGVFYTLLGQDRFGTVDE
ncbi:DUF3943 domain-containing protein [Ramlibacter sp. G-1-2-2]|uniref:DUF3943 domain-containing protein n=1 Tax=Ramlibacter agri TaxID=2728837 RepID=A0A848GZ84_9BURK|nr:DUF3943 domain-containing protein [Ramlibacter agri]NML42632.1 DUF3943 domain-containing protein [Ramlibacter agri]